MAEVVGPPVLPVEWLRQLASARRFGERDRYGTANLIDGAARQRAVSAIKTGASVSLARPLSDGPSLRGDNERSFSLTTFLNHVPIEVASDHLELDCHNQLNTHLDGLNHMGMDQTWYSGWGLDDPSGPSIADFAEAGLVARAVHVDIPAVRGERWVDVDHPVTGAEIDTALKLGGITFAPGDALLVDMGRDLYEAAGFEWSHDENPGIGLDGAHWIVDHDVSIVCWDFLDATHPREPFLPVHMLIWAIGLLLVDNCDFSLLRTKLGPGQIAGAVVIAPLPIAGATGNNVNPIVLL